MDEYLIPTQFGEAEFVEKKSRFIGRVWPVDTEEEALAKIQEMKKKHYDATHNCWAYIIRDGAARFSDDGEPGGTAGMPMLQVLQRECLFNVVCVVTRYFGGILLGAGGLVRAYTKGAKIAVDAAGKSMKRVWTAVYVPCPYPFYERVKLEAAADKTGHGVDVGHGASVGHSCRDVPAVLVQAEFVVELVGLVHAVSGDRNDLSGTAGKVDHAAVADD